MAVCAPSLIPSRLLPAVDWSGTADQHPAHVEGRACHASYASSAGTADLYLWGADRGRLFAPEDAHSVWREIEMAANQTLAELGEAIPLAFDFDDPHLVVLPQRPGLGGRASMRSKASPIRWGGRRPVPRANRDWEVPLPGASGKKEFLFLFDFGDEWHFGVKLVRQSPTVEMEVRYPRVVAQAGEAPPQYPDLDEEDEED